MLTIPCTEFFKKKNYYRLRLISFCLSIRDLVRSIESINRINRIVLANYKGDPFSFFFLKKAISSFVQTNKNRDFAYARFVMTNESASLLYFPRWINSRPPPNRCRLSATVERGNILTRISGHRENERPRLLFGLSGTCN